ncbi:hypothetical protein Golomagni_06575 [Golovinomyces magnicellulatus]|nr:hypothetical protein Golomagni_06575 [Golovinomyces magnicellulatus]
MAEEGDRFPLHTAAREGKVNVVEALLKTNPKLSKVKDDDGRYAIHWAASANNLDIVVLLANQSGFDPDVQDGSGWTPLMISASVPESEAVLQVLLKADADVNEKSTYIIANYKDSTLTVFCRQQWSAKLLIDAKPPASTRVRDRRGQYPIHRAAAVGSVPIVLLLLKNRSPLNATDNEGYTPLHHAIAEGHGDTAVALLKEGADFTLKNTDEVLALDLAPDKEVRKYIEQGAEREGIDLGVQA